MSRTIEITAKTVEEARELALKELDADPGEVEIDVVSRGKAGLLGIVGGEPARVRATLLEAPPDVVRVTTDVLDNLISKLGVSVVVNLKQAFQEEVGGPVFHIEGDDSGLLIGRRGETLRSFQYLVKLIASRKLETNPNMMVDVEGYQERRYGTLKNLAERVAQRVVASGRPITLEPMPPNERRIVHMALADDPRVTTESIGVAESRQIVVQPN